MGISRQTGDQGEEQVFGSSRCLKVKLLQPQCHPKMWVWLGCATILLLGASLPTGQPHPVGTTLGDETQGRQGLRSIIYCTLLKHGLVKGERKPPMLSHVRVSRGPEEDSRHSSDNLDFGQSHNLDLDSEVEDANDESRSFKAPSYQHKLMNRLSQFHSIPRYSSDVTFSLGPYASGIYPVASIQAKGVGVGVGGDGGGPFSQGHPVTFHSGLDEDPTGHGGQFQFQGDGAQSPTFTPYIGSRVLSNIPKFFQHIQENIKAIHDSREAAAAAAATGDDSSISVEHPSFMDVESGESQMDIPSRRGDYFQSDGRLVVDTSGAGGGYRYLPQPSNDADYASNEMLKFMGRDPKYKKANNYNPSWLFTNLGLGKRSGYQGQGQGLGRFHPKGGMGQG